MRKVGMKAPSLRALSPVLLAVLCFGFCSCGGSSGPKPATGGCDKGVGLCITNCNLGCSSSRCSVTNIAVNQTLVLEFNQEIDPGTVNNATFRLRTASGAEPVGSYFVQSNVVMFIPEVRTIGGQTFFGFVRDESYVMTFPSPDTSVEVIRAKSGDALPVPFSCTLTVSEGIKDFDNKAPTAELLIPANRVGVSPETQIVVEFSEIVLTSSLSGPGQGLKFSIGNTTASGGCGGGAQELPGTLEFKVNQLLQRTQALFEPAGRLPGDKCIFVDVTDEIRDLSGKRAEPVTFNFITAGGEVAVPLAGGLHAIAGLETYAVQRTLPQEIQVLTG
ncbi:MAG: Ig-like domain-containing protein, partial [Planctomycetota bacterium]